MAGFNASVVGLGVGFDDKGGSVSDGLTAELLSTLQAMLEERLATVPHDVGSLELRAELAAQAASASAGPLPAAAPGAAIAAEAPPEPRPAAPAAAPAVSPPPAAG